MTAIVSAAVFDALNSTLKNGYRTFQRCIYSCNVLQREFRKNKRQNIVIKEDRVPQERSFEIEPAWIKKCDFPDENTKDRLFNGVKYSDLPIVSINVTKNNTKYTLSIYNQVAQVRSCGIEGFKNTKKGTNIAAQATAITFSNKSRRLGFDQVRVLIRGLGPGRMASIKGLEMGGLNIVSITDETPYCLGGYRPRKAKRL